ncbi:unnamed protein product, partial [marine sediment metagenome]
MVYESSTVAGSYDRGRELPPETLQLWLRVLGECVPRPVSRLLDLGSGTGRFSGPLAEYFSARVVGVDPSLEMVRRAAQKHQECFARFVVGT